MESMEDSKKIYMTKELAQKKFAEWANISESLLMFVKEVKDAFHFIYERNNRYFKIAIGKTDERFYSMQITQNNQQIDLYRQKQYQFVKTFLNKNRALLDEVAATLQEKHSLNNDEVKEIYKRIKY